MSSIENFFDDKPVGFSEDIITSFRNHFRTNGLAQSLAILLNGDHEDKRNFYHFLSKKLSEDLKHQTTDIIGAIRGSDSVNLLRLNAKCIKVLNEINASQKAPSQVEGVDNGTETGGVVEKRDDGIIIRKNKIN